jgi:Uma2 family endonuclease
MTATIPRLSLQEFLTRPETKPASEFVDGQIRQKPMPQGKHSRLQYKLCGAVNAVTEPDRLALAFPELRCTFDGRSIVPDVAVFTWSRIPFEADGEVPNVFNTAPDWTIEILSPEQRTTKVISNILSCLRHGTELGWLIDPDERVILVFAAGQAPIELVGEDLLPVPAFGDLQLTVAQVFGWLRAGG